MLKRAQWELVAVAGMTYQTDEKYLNSLIEYFVGGLVLHLIV
jgi:hypothetical protein